MPITLPDKPIETPFEVPKNRREVTEEPTDAFMKSQVSWDGWAAHGGGHVPDDYAWTSNPKERQDALMGEWPEGS